MIGTALNRILDQQTAKILLAVLLVILLLFPWVAGESGRYYTVLLMTVFIFATLGHAWNLLAGFCGLLSFGTQVYIGLSGFTVAILNYYFNVPVWWSLPVGAVVAALFAWLLAVPISDMNSKRNVWIGVVIAIILWGLYEILINNTPQADIFGGDYIRRVILLLLIFLGALPLLKLQGAYFAVATWLIAAAVASIFKEWRVVGAGGGMNIVSETTIVERYYAGLIILAVSTAVVWWLLNSRYGKALTAVRDDEEAATAIGIDIRRVKTLVFVISAPMAALGAGLFYVDAVTITPPDAFHIRWSAYVVFIVVAGGMGSLSGPIIGAVAFVIVQRFLAGFWGGGELTLGIAAVLLILILPRGIVGLIDDLRRSAADPGLRKNKSSSFFKKPAIISRDKQQFDISQPGVVSAFMVPANPLPFLVRGNPPWRPLVEGYELARAALEASKPDVILLYSSSWMAVLDQPFQMRARLAGSHVDENWHEFGELNYDFSIDREAANAIIKACGDIGISAKPVDYDQFPIDSGTITATGFLNSDTRLPLVIAAANIYHDYDQTFDMGAAAAKAAVALGRRVAIVGVGGLSGSIFRNEISIMQDRLKQPQDDEWNRSILKMLEQADVPALKLAIPQFVKEARAENGFKHFAWLAGAIGDQWEGADILGYGPTYGAGAAIVQFNLKDPSDLPGANRR